MRTHAPTRPPDAAEPPAPPRARPSAWLREHLPSLIVVAAAGGLVAAFFLALYWVKHYDMPIGWDTPRYLDQTSLVAAHGLAGVPKQLPPPIKTLPSRGGFPILILTLSSLFGVSTFAMAAIVPAAAAMAIALGAGALVTWTLRRGAWSLAAVAVVVGTSAVVIRLMAPETYSDNLFAAAIFTAAILPLLSAATGREGFVAATILLGAGAIAHSPSFAVVAAALGLTALVLLPWSWRAWRRDGIGPLGTPSVRIGGAVAAGGALAGAAILGVLRATPDAPKLSRGELTKKLREDLPLYRYWLALPLAALGAVGLWTNRRPEPSEPSERPERPEPSEPSEGQEAQEAEGTRRADAARPAVLRPSRVLLIVLLSWCVIAAGGVALFVLGRTTPAHRFLSFLLPIPILMAVGVLWIGRLAARRGGRAVGAGVVVATIAVLGVFGYHDLYSTLAGPTRGVEWLDPGKVQDAATAATYLDAIGVPNDAPVVFVIDDQGPNPLSYVPEMTYMLRAVLPADRVPHTYVYVGNPNRYLAGQPTYREHPKTYDANADRFWPTVRSLLPQEPVALVLSSYNPMYRAVAAAHPGWIVAPNVVALHGRRPAEPVAAPAIPRGPRGAVRGGLLGIATLAALALAGLGWSAGSLPRSVRPFEVLALAPAFGFAFLLLGGIAADALGLRLVGVPGALTAAAVGTLGAAFALARHRGRSPRAGDRA